MLFPTITPFMAMLAFAAEAPAVPKWASAPFLAMPFDAMRALYADAVKAGLVKESMLASGHFSKMVHDLETLTLGPLARQV